MGGRVFNSAVRLFLKYFEPLGVGIVPPITTHNMVYEDDPILTNFRRCRLFNHCNDRVKVILHPQFLRSDNTLLPIDYTDFMKGCDLGVFPSYYEPWGYTPAECISMGIPCISTNLSGFGRYMEDLNIAHLGQQHGVYVIDRRFQSLEESIHQLRDVMFYQTGLSRLESVIQRQHTLSLSHYHDWSNVYPAYQKARAMASK